MIVCKKMNMIYFGWQLLNIAIKFKLLVIPVKIPTVDPKLLNFMQKSKGPVHIAYWFCQPISISFKTKDMIYLGLLHSYTRYYDF